MRLLILLLSAVLLPLISFAQKKPTRTYLSVPVIDLDKESFRQVVVDREEGQYLGHVTTVLLDDGKTILAVYPKGHGSGEIVCKRSTDGGVTWSERITLPESWRSSKEVPTIFRTVDQYDRKRLIMFSGLYPARLALSEDEGKSWSGLNMAGDWGGIVVMASLIPLKTGKGHYMAFFHDDMRYFSSDGESKFREDRKTGGKPLFTVYKTVSTDGGLNWSFPEPILNSRDMNLCEPGAVRSPNGKKIALLLRENGRKNNSQIIISSDEGKTWSDPKPLPNELTGDRHTLKYFPDGRIIAVFRDVSPSVYRDSLVKAASGRKDINLSAVASETGLGSPTEGDWAGWVGRWNDLVKGRKGQYRIRFKDNIHGWDCCYPGIEMLPDGTFVVITYGHWERENEPYILGIRFKPEELDAKFKEIRKHKK